MALIAPNIAQPGGRDPRLDAFRGLALAMIFIDHVPGNPYEQFTLRNIGFSDAAEAFFFMSGVAAGLAYSGRFGAERRAANGLWSAVRPMWMRAWTLYKTHIALTFSVIAIFAFAALAFAMPEMANKHNLGAVFTDPWRTIPALFTMTHQIGYVNILPAYCVLLFVAPFALMAGLKHPGWLLTGAVALWMAAGTWRLNIPNWPGGGGWFFNPFSWQLIFVLGLVAGIKSKAGQRLVPVSGWLFTAALGFLLFVYAWRHVPELGKFMNTQMWRLGEAGAPYHFVAHSKTFLALPRLLHVLAMVYVLSCLPWVVALCASAAAAPLRLMGQQGLEVFATGTVIAMAFQALMDMNGDPAILGVVLPPLGLVLLWLIALRAQRRKAGAVIPAKPSAVQA
ncbi:OpgC domain-containing protein [Sagittula sp. NFXS13]|uniref:OpgC family protein n=1 Tax=Sagittula sp. NFXS13 TaxID=2819095 RepID=UPI0032DEA241